MGRVDSWAMKGYTAMLFNNKVWDIFYLIPPLRNLWTSESYGQFLLHRLDLSITPGISFQLGIFRASTGT